MGSINTETETVIKKILPYMKRRGYNIEQDFDFETAVSTTDRYTKGYVDILVTLGKKTPFFLIEAKRLGKNLTKKIEIRLFCMPDQKNKSSFCSRYKWKRYTVF